MSLSFPVKPIKTLHDRRLAYLIGLQDYYDKEGFVTKLNGRGNLLEIYPEGTVIPKTEEEIVIEKWIG